MFDFTKHVSTRLRRLSTPQAEPIPGSTQISNSAGGYAWAVDHWTRLDRFLVLGAEGGTFYIGERELTVEKAKAVVECLAEDGVRVVQRAVEIGESGRWKASPWIQDCSRAARSVAQLRELVSWIAG